jgi:hypothetical protein
LIATCLANSAMVAHIQDGEHAVRTIFAENFPHDRFDAWNTIVDAATASAIIGNVGRAMRIHVDRFIEELWHTPQHGDSI